MNEQKLFLSYLKGLLKQWYFTVTLIIGAIDIFIRPFFDIPIPWWVFLGLFGLAFIAANYQLHRQTQHQIKQLQEQHQQRLAQAQAETNELRNREPRLDLRFTDTSAKRITLKVLKLPEPINDDEFVQREAEVLEATYTNLGKSDPLESANDPFGVGGIALDVIRSMQNHMRGTLKSKEEYDDDCKRYLQSFRRFLLERESHASYLARYRTLEFVVDNTGTQPAKDVTIIIDFPDEFRFPISDEEKEFLLLSRDPPEAPEVPSLYKPGPLEFMQQNRSFMIPPISDHFAHYSGPDLEYPNASGPFIRPKNSTEVTYEIDRLVHNFVQELNPVEFYLTEDAIGHSLELTYSIHAANLMRPIKGSLIVAVELSQEGQ